MGEVKLLWFTKRRRAQTKNDFETWIEGGVCPTLNAFDNTGDSRATVVIVFAPGPMVRLGGNIWENGVVPTLRAEAKRGDAEPHLLIMFDNSYRDGIRIQKGNTVNTLSAKMGTGGNNVPFVAQEQPVAIPIQDGREMEKKQNGMGIGQEGDPSYTLDQTGAQAVAYSIREDAKANNFSATEIQTARALQSLWPSVQSHHAQTFIAEPTMQVRRLTPTECERLMGWPDNHTIPRADGKTNSDTTRYKMCGNGVASPVAQWIGETLMAIHNGAS